MAQKTPPDSTRRSERSRRAIYDAALALVTEVGYAKLTIEAIAARAGVGKQTIYRWWTSKGAVLLDAFLDLGDQAARAAGENAGQAEIQSEIPNSGDLEADLKYVLRATVDEFNDAKYDAPYRALAAEGLLNPELGAEFVEKLLEPQLQLYVKRVEQARDAGQVAPGVDPRIALELWAGPLAQRWLMRSGPLTHDYADKLVEYALYGIAPRPETS
ncbi:MULTISPECIES: TetR/AcrR family transcriptional regulator [Streptomyces]|uniref:TetR family transcriptional regulator n=1 Tax=Streptomyces venezuelae TaxID=54571 RepID=A0A5P2BCA7_STRVZ|nr:MULTISPECIES: TetR/AcrR family transcriptional regulator [Streptomyces]NEA03781.1 TetR/AcrR family transcriptional regulator [Streptomyces sp. SID10116]MYY80411.1 TetR family transcriptional regulator [Streptomyces sp. SID335]MYZ15211.1 TetR family transcriptional regulator [Streptomyces sp. SID337]NDZ88838.1 TetR/AcrR family transcriptional regulator [Streptomyces sp. SID10115]NEB44529.1 TetR/AcrR family transcriptional regulator [Streptomyces sp. SID339]